MKKTATFSTLLLLTATSQAYTLLDNGNSGTNVEFNGSARLLWQSSAHKNREENGQTRREHINHAIANDDSRVGFKLTQQLGGGVYALGNVEWRARGTAASQHNFDDWYTRELYAGFGHQSYGELTYGNQTLITDEVRQTDLPNVLSLSGGLLPDMARRTTQYTYSGIDGLKLGVYYGSSSKRDNEGLDFESRRKDIRGAGAVYDYQINEQQNLRIGLGTSRERYHNDNGTASQIRGYAFGSAYTFAETTIGLDLERQVAKNETGQGEKRITKEVRTLLAHKLTADLNAYTMYAYKTSKSLNAVEKEKTREFMLGAEYEIGQSLLSPYHLSAKTFVEWQTSRTQSYTNGAKTQKIRNNETVVGLRLSW